MRMQPSSGQRRGLATNSTQDSFTLTAGRYAISWSSGIAQISDGTNTHNILLMEKYRGVVLGFGGAGSNNNLADFRLWIVKFGFSRSEEVPDPDMNSAIDCDVAALLADTSRITLGTGTGVSGGVYTASELIADTLSVTLATTATTPKGIGESLENAYALGDMTVYSPADNTPAKLIIPHVRGHGLIVEFNKDTATSMNYDAELVL